MIYDTYAYANTTLDDIITNIRTVDLRTVHTEHLLVVRTYFRELNLAYRLWNLPPPEWAKARYNEVETLLQQRTNKMY